VFFDEILRDHHCPLLVTKYEFRRLVARGAVAAMCAQRLLKIPESGDGHVPPAMSLWHQIVVVTDDQPSVEDPTRARCFWCIRMAFQHATFDKLEGTRFLWPLSSKDARWLFAFAVQDPMLNGTAGYEVSSLLTNGQPEANFNATCLALDPTRIVTRMRSLADRIVVAAFEPAQPAHPPNMCACTRSVKCVGGRKRSSRPRRSPRKNIPLVDTLPLDLLQCVWHVALQHVLTSPCHTDFLDLLAWRRVCRAVGGVVQEAVAVQMRVLLNSAATVVYNTKASLHYAYMLRGWATKHAAMDVFLVVHAMRLYVMRRRLGLSLLHDEQLERMYLRLRSGALSKKFRPRWRQLVGPFPPNIGLFADARAHDANGAH
jgi:hypothetical protein